MAIERTVSLTRGEEYLVSYLRRAAESIRPSAAVIEEGWIYTSHFDLLLREGRLFTPAPLPDGIGRLHPGFCYTNSSQLAEEHPELELTYVEGYGTAPISGGQVVPLPHGWAATPEGVVLDATWPHEQGTAFIGLPFADPAMWPDPRSGRSLLQEPPFLGDWLRDGLPRGVLADLGRPVPR